MVMTTKDTALSAVVATVCRILGLNLPHSELVEVTEDRVDADAVMQTTLKNLLSRIGNMWVPWADLTTQPNQMLDRLLHPPSVLVRSRGLAASWASTTHGINRATGPRVGGTARRQTRVGLSC